MSHYQIILRGVTNGQSIDQVVESLARYSKKSPEALRALLTSGRDVIANRTLDEQHAVRYKQALEKIGCVCVIQAKITAPPAGSRADSNTSVLVTNFTDGHSGNHAVAREYQYASAPLAVRMRAITDTARMTMWVGLIAVLVVA